MATAVHEERSFGRSADRSARHAGGRTGGRPASRSAQRILAPYGLLVMFELLALPGVPTSRLYAIGAALTGLMMVLTPGHVATGLSRLIGRAGAALGLVALFSVTTMLSLLDAVDYPSHLVDVRSVNFAIVAGITCGAVACSGRIGIHHVRRAFTFGGVVGSLFLLFAPTSVGWREGIRNTALGQDPNELASWIGATLALYLYPVVFSRGRSRRITLPSLAAIGILSAGLLATGSRGGLVGLVFGIGLAGLLGSAIRFAVVKRAAVGLVILGLLFGLVVATVGADRLPLQTTSLSRFFDDTAQSTTDSTGARGYAATQGVRTAVEYPFNGIGAGGKNLPGERGGPAIGSHNTFIQPAAQYGLLSAVVLTALIAGLSWQLVRRRRGDADALGAALLVMATSGLSVALEGEKVLWLAVGLALAFLASDGSRPAGEDDAVGAGRERADDDRLSAGH